MFKKVLLTYNFWNPSLMESYEYLIDPDDH